MWINYQWSFSQTQQSNPPPKKNSRAQQVFLSHVSTRAWRDELVNAKLVPKELTQKSITAKRWQKFWAIHPFAKCKGIQDSLGFWIPPRGFRIPIISGIPDSWSCILDSKAQDSTFYKLKFPGFWLHKQKFPGIRNPDSHYTWRDPLATVPPPYLDSYENKLYYDLKASISFILPFI